MPRPNPQRTIASEQSLARRIQYERETRGMSYEGLALRMTKAGCPINASGLYKIEKADPPRRITVDELVALARVFQTDIGELLQPPEKVLDRELLRLMRKMMDALDQTLAADENYKKALREFAEFVADHPDRTAQLSGEMSLQSVIETLRDVDRDEDHRLADRLERLTGGEHQEA